MGEIKRRLSTQDVEVKTSDKPATVLEFIWWSLTTAMTTWSLLAIGLAKLNVFYSLNLWVLASPDLVDS
jgi:hypothetical protein